MPLQIQPRPKQPNNVDPLLSQISNPECREFVEKVRKQKEKQTLSEDRGQKQSEIPSLLPPLPKLPMISYPKPSGSSKNNEGTFSNDKSPDIISLDSRRLVLTPPPSEKRRFCPGL